MCGVLKIWLHPTFFSCSLLVFGVEKQEAELNAGCACSAVPHPGVAATASFHHSGTSEGWILHPVQLHGIVQPEKSCLSTTGPSPSLPPAEIDLLKSYLEFEGHFESDPCFLISVVFVGEDAIMSTSRWPWGNLGQLQNLRGVSVHD